MFSGFFGALIFKLSELIEKRKALEPAQIALFVAKAFFTQVASSVFYLPMFFRACECTAEPLFGRLRFSSDRCCPRADNAVF